MRRKGPSYRLWFSLDGQEPRQELMAGRHFRMNYHGLSRNLYESLPFRLKDMLRIASAAYVVDRFAKRGGQTKTHGWFRSLHVTVEVLEPDFWKAPKTRNKLAECLDTVGGDSWEWTFVPDKFREFASYQREFRFTNSPTSLVCLHSTGLDSTAGLARRLRGGPTEQFIPVLVRHQTGQRGLALKQLQTLRQHYGLRPEHLQPVMVGIRAYPSRIHLAGIEGEENSQRCRSFLFASVGGVVAAAIGASSIEVYESGIGAVNLPLMTGMVGSKATKGSHPRFLRLMSSLMTLVAEREISFALPFLENTKAEIVTTLAEEGLHELARATVSCVHYPLRERPHKQCGVCPSCIFRRQAMAYAGIEEQSDKYKFDLFGRRLEGGEVPPEETRFLKAFLMLISKLSKLESPSLVPGFFRRHLVGTGIVDDGEPVDSVYRSISTLPERMAHAGRQGPSKCLVIG